MPYRYEPKPIEQMDNLGGIGAAIKSRERKLYEARRALESGELLNGRKVTKIKRVALIMQAEQAEKELAILVERRRIVTDRGTEFPGRATARPAPSPATGSGADASDWD